MKNVHEAVRGLGAALAGFGARFAVVFHIADEGARALRWASLLAAVAGWTVIFGVVAERAMAPGETVIAKADRARVGGEGR